jgi:hypothetical protein
MDAVAAAAASVPRLYALGEVPTAPQMPYTSFSASLGRGDALGLLGDEGIRWGQIVMQHFAATAANALDEAETARALVIGTALDIAGYDATPCEQEIDPQIVRDPDNRGVIGVTQTFTFTATKEP